MIMIDTGPTSTGPASTGPTSTGPTSTVPMLRVRFLRQTHWCGLEPWTLACKVHVIVLNHQYTALSCLFGDINICFVLNVMVTNKNFRCSTELIYVIIIPDFQVIAICTPVTTYYQNSNHQIIITTIINNYDCMGTLSYLNDCRFGSVTATPGQRVYSVFLSTLRVIDTGGGNCVE